MVSFGFQNFKKYKDFDAIALNNINFLVGANNSGKSTFIKALLLALYNLRNVKNINSSIRNIFELPLFKFDIDNISNPKVGTYARAQNCFNVDDDIVFHINIGGLQVSYAISKEARGKNYADSQFAPITQVCLYNPELDAEIRFFTEEEIAEIEFHSSNKGIDYGFYAQLLDGEEKKLENLTKRGYPAPKSEVQEIEDRIALFKNLATCPYNTYCRLEYKIAEYNDGKIESFIKHLLNSLKKAVLHADPSDNSINPEVVTNDVDHRLRLYNIVELSDFLFSKNIQNKEIEYIYAHTAKRAIVYDINDRNDYTAHTIHNYIMAGITEGSIEYGFITKWMQIFGIGDDFRIESDSGELYKVWIISRKEDSEIKELLSDKGTGTIHLMELLIKLATIYRKYVGTQVAPTIIIEEPEQNLHPKAQSKLTEMLLDILDMSEKYSSGGLGFQFIIETHSEYMIRHSQLVAKSISEGKSTIKDNPFETIYFPEHEQPYSMQYLPNGRFKNKFKTGFFDEADKLALMLI